ncbi:MAG: helix-turn-helix transcriptional regulator [Silicimonas sp.]|nr:helix-turn-helix transcriptional regulator [Silicimonas sp.]
MTENRHIVLLSLFVLQALCTVFFVGEAVADFSETPDPDDDGSDILEYAVSLALALSTLFTGFELRRMIRRDKRMTRQLDVASGAFADLLETHFSEWGLTAAEREVALLAIKGYSVAETARIRASSEGTIKAQNAAIYRKAGVSGRLQLISLFIEDLLADGLIEADAARA